MSALPLKLKVAVRDQWDKEDGPLQTSLKALEGLLGHQVAIDPEWQLLLAELDGFYPDKANFVAILAGCVQTWARSMTELLDDSENEDWTEKVLDKSSFGRLRVFLEVSRSDKASTSWSDERNGFIIDLPKKQLFQPTELFPIFRGQLLACFDVSKKAQLPIREASGSGAGAADDWADVEMDTTTGKPNVVEKGRPLPSAQTRAIVEFLPNVQSLPRPDQLFLRPPYHLSVIPGHQGIEIQSSHSPSLKVLSDYLKKWCRVNHYDTTSPPAVQVTLSQSAFGLGEMFDRLTITTKDTRYTNQFQVTTPMIIAFVEGILGYEQVSDRGTFNFRRDVEFKAL